MESLFLVFKLCICLVNINKVNVCDTLLNLHIITILFCFLKAGQKS